MSILMTFVLYYWILSVNIYSHFSWYLYAKIYKWAPMYLILLALTCVVFSYVILIFLLMLCHVGLRLRLYMHWSHKSVLCLVVMGCVFGTLQYISLMTTGPFLHVMATGLMTGLTWFIAESWCTRTNIGVKVTWLVIYAVGMLALYLTPLTIRSPCICDDADLPSKPLMFSHRGASAIAPENTMMAFEKAARLDQVFGLESDVSISYDGVPFLLHDRTLSRTTNIQDVFPNYAEQYAGMLNMSQIKQLDAGSWFLQEDPHGTASSLPEEDIALIRSKKITVPTLAELLTLVKSSGKKLMFDLSTFEYGIPEDHPYFHTYADVVINTILQHDIPQQNVYWLYTEVLNTTVAQHFTVVYGKSAANAELLQHNDIKVNLGFDHAEWDDVKDLQSHNVSVNVWVVNREWLYSLYWCLGVHSITTNHVQSFSQLSKPVWHLTPLQFYIIWIVTDMLSLIIVVIIFIVQSCCRTNKRKYRY